MYYFGQYVEINYEKAYEFFSQLVEERNYASAKYYIGRMYYYGQYLPQNYQKAFDIFEELVETNNDYDAKYYLGETYYYGLNGEISYQKAYNIFMELIEKFQCPRSSYYVGRMYYFGQYVEKDYSKAYKLLVNASNASNNGEAEIMIAMILIKTKNTPDAISWIEKSMKKRNVKAYGLLGRIYYLGEKGGFNVQVNKEYGLELLEIAAKNGDKSSIDILEKIKQGNI